MGRAERDKCMDENEKNYNKHVKEQLIKWRSEFEARMNSTLNYAAIAQAMEKQFGIETSDQKIAKMFDLNEKREVKLAELVALSKLFDIPLLTLCDYPNAPVTIDVSHLLKGSKKKQYSGISQFKDNYYTGDYYCYYYEPKHYTDRIYPVAENCLEEALLNISIELGQTVVTLKEMKTSTTFYGDAMPSFELTGKLYHLENSDIAYCYLCDPQGRRAAALMFSYINLSDDIRYYMTAAKMSISTNQTHAPLFQKMAMFRVRQNIQNADEADAVRGILALNSGPIILDEETIARLSAEDESFKRLLSTERSLKKCYAFSETALRCEAFFIGDDNEKMEKMLTLRKNSLLNSHEIVAEPNYFADFIRQYQINQMEEEQSPE